VKKLTPVRMVDLSMKKMRFVIVLQDSPEKTVKLQTNQIHVTLTHVKMVALVLRVTVPAQLDSWVPIVKPKTHVSLIHVKMAVLVHLAIVPAQLGFWVIIVKQKTHVNQIHVRMAVLVQMVTVHAQPDI